MSLRHPFVFTLALSCLLVGCGTDDGVSVVDTSDAEFSTDEDYAAYDKQMSEESAGQSE